MLKKIKNLNIVSDVPEFINAGQDTLIINKGYVQKFNGDQIWNTVVMFDKILSHGKH